MLGLGLPEIIVILLIVLVLFGAGKLPRVMGDLGRGVKAFKAGLDEQGAPMESKQARPRASRTKGKSKI